LTTQVWATRQDQVLDAMRDEIITGRIAPGARLVQDELAARFGVSRIPLREALRTLEGEGLVEIAPHRGAVCRPLAPRDIADLYDVRLALEMLACRSAAERFADVRTSTETLRKEAAVAIERHDLASLIHGDRCFHANVADASANLCLAATLGTSWGPIMRAMHYFFTIARYPANVWAEHIGIARAIAVGDGDAASSAMEQHITRSRDAILRSLKESET